LTFVVKGFFVFFDPSNLNINIKYVKNLSLILNVVLIIAVGVLYFMFFKQKSEGSYHSVGGDSTQTIDILQPALPLPKGDQKIVYINLDTLQSKYEFIKKLNKDLDSKGRADQARLEAKANELQAEYMKYQQQFQAQTMTEQQAQDAQMDMERKKQALDLLDQKITKDYTDEAKKAQDRYIDNLNEYLRRRSKEHHYAYVLGYVKGAQIIFANDSLDITKQVVDGLNKEYKSKSIK
jgi:outer membrane protein